MPHPYLIPLLNCPTLPRSYPAHSYPAPLLPLLDSYHCPTLSHFYPSTLLPLHTSTPPHFYPSTLLPLHTSTPPHFYPSTLLPRPLSYACPTPAPLLPLPHSYPASTPTLPPLLPLPHSCPHSYPCPTPSPLLPFSIHEKHYNLHNSVRKHSQVEFRRTRLQECIQTDCITRFAQRHSDCGLCRHSLHDLTKTHAINRKFDSYGNYMRHIAWVSFKKDVS